MKKKLMTVVLSTMVVLGGAGNALAAETGAGTAERAGGCWKLFGSQSYFTKYICQAGVWKPGTSDGVTIPGVQKPDTESKPESGSRQAQVVRLVNQERAAAGLGSLSYDSQLAVVAQKKAEDMAKNGYFSHTSPTYGSAFDMLKAAGISYRTAGENIAKGQKTAETVMNGWMNSSGHRANILSSSYTRIGVGYAVDGSGTPYWVQIFAG
ncbi:MAG: CAP domain-containing protein [Anaerovoracaceae bacterium]